MNDSDLIRRGDVAWAFEQAIAAPGLIGRNTIEKVVASLPASAVAAAAVALAEAVIAHWDVLLHDPASCATKEWIAVTESEKRYRAAKAARAEGDKR